MVWNFPPPTVPASRNMPRKAQMPLHGKHSILVLLLLLPFLPPVMPVTSSITASSTSSKTPSRTASGTRTASTTSTASRTPSSTFTPTRSGTRSPSATITASFSRTATKTSSPGSSPSQTPTVTPTNSKTPSNTPSFTATGSQTTSPTATPSISGTPSHTPTLSSTNSVSPTPCAPGQDAQDSVNHCPPCPKGTASKFSGDGCAPCNVQPLGGDPNYPYVNAFSPNTGSKVCRWCPPYTYSNTTGAECLPCPGGHWWSNSTTDFGINLPQSSGPGGIIPPCSSPLMACPTSTCTSTGCTQGYSGYLCSACALGYYKTYAGTCSLCPQTFYVSLGVVLLLFVCLSVFILWFLQVTDGKRRKALMAELSGLLTPSLLLDHFTRLLLLHRLKGVPYPDNFTNTVGVTSLLGFDFDSTGPQCLINNLSFDWRWFIVMGGMGGIQGLALITDLGLAITQALKRLIASSKERAGRTPGGAATPSSGRSDSRSSGSSGGGGEPAESSGGSSPVIFPLSPTSPTSTATTATAAPAAAAPSPRNTFTSSHATLSFVLPMGAQMAFMALTSSTLTNGSSVLFFDTELLFFNFPHILVAAFSLAFLFFYMVWCLAAAGLFMFYHFNRAEDKVQSKVERTNAAWVAAQRCFGFARAGTTMLSPTPVIAMGYLVGVGLVEALLALCLFDQVASLMERRAKEALKKSAPFFQASRRRLKVSASSPQGDMEEEREVWGCGGVGCGGLLKRVGLKGVRGQLALFLAVSIITQVSGLGFSLASNRSQVNSAGSFSVAWGVVIVVLNAAIFLVFLVPLARSFVPRMFLLCPRRPPPVDGGVGGSSSALTPFSPTPGTGTGSGGGSPSLTDNPLRRGGGGGEEGGTHQGIRLRWEDSDLDPKDGGDDGASSKSGGAKGEGKEKVKVMVEERGKGKEWFQLTSDEGEAYYQRLCDGDTAWDLPPGAVLVPEPPLLVSSDTVPSPAAPASGNEWFEVRDAQNVEFWYQNVSTGVTSWALPKGAVVVPAPL